MDGMDPQIYRAIATELLAMAHVDQAMRTAAVKDMSQWDQSVDQRNTARIKAIVGEIGWPTISRVGAEASQSAWLLVQHAAAEPAFMKLCLTLMRDAATGDVAPANMAYLEDRLLTMEGKPQVYGTQFRIIAGGIQPFPIEDPDHVDERRARVGLETLAEHTARGKAMYGF
jgi:hypothetical protein